MHSNSNSNSNSSFGIRIHINSILLSQKKLYKQFFFSDIHQKRGDKKRYKFKYSQKTKNTFFQKYKNSFL